MQNSSQFLWFILLKKRVIINTRFLDYLQRISQVLFKVAGVSFEIIIFKELDNTYAVI